SCTGVHENKDSRPRYQARHCGPRFPRLRRSTAVHGRLQPHSLERTSELGPGQYDHEDVLSTADPAAALRLQNSAADARDDAVVESAAQRQLARIRLYRAAKRPA